MGGCLSSNKASDVGPAAGDSGYGVSPRRASPLRDNETLTTPPTVSLAQFSLPFER